MKKKWFWFPGASGIGTNASFLFFSFLNVKIPFALLQNHSISVIIVSTQSNVLSSFRIFPI